MPSTHRQAPVVAVLGVMMIFTWGSSYYLMAVLAQPIAQDTGWALEWITAALALGLVIAGLISPAAGRVISHYGGRPVLASGCLLIASGLMVLSLANSLHVFALGWILMGLGMAAGLYDPAFSTLGHLYGIDARAAITQLTLWGGFASTVCWPLSAYLLDHFGWRGVCLAYAVILIVLILPVVLRFVPALSVEKAPEYRGWHKPDGVLEHSLNERLFILLMSLLLVLHGLVAVNVALWVFTLLEAQAVPVEKAIFYAALIGPAQVAARLLEMMARGRHHPLWTLAASVSLIAMGMLCLLFGGVAAAFALILFGAGNGLHSIARGALPLAVIGAERYPLVMGELARPALIAQASAPILGALVLRLTGADGLAIALIGLAVANFMIFLLLWRGVRFTSI